MFWSPRLASAEVFDLDDAAPWLTVGRSPVRFSRGWDAFVVADSSCVRVNARGVYAKPSHWTPRDLGPPWSSVPCAPGSRGGLCESRTGVAFPDASALGPPLYNASGAWGGMSCSRALDGRVLDVEYGYDVTACDVLDDGGDVAYCGRALYFARTGLAEGVYWAVCLVAVFVVRSLSYLVVNKLGAKASGEATGGSSDLLTVAACVAVIPMSLVPHGDALFITVEEALFFDAVCAYAGLYAALFVVHRYAGGTDDPPVYNLIAATLQIIACRLYLSADTPYNPVITWAVATRALVKLRSAGWGTWILALTAWADAVLLSLMCAYSFGHDRLYLVAVFVLSACTSDALVGN